MTRREPKVSVVMPVYNGERFLAQAVESVLLQSFTDFEFLVIDDGSTDDTSAILKSYRDDRFRVVNQENRGQANSRNRGSLMARGEYIAVMDHDDVCALTRLEKQVETLDADSDLAVVSSFAVLIDGTGGSTGLVERIRDPVYRLWVLQFGNVLVNTATMIRRQALEAVGYYDESFLVAGDYDLWCRIAQRSNIHILPEYLCFYRVWSSEHQLSGMVDQVIVETLAISDRNLKACCPSLSDRECRLARALYPVLGPSAMTGEGVQLIPSIIEGFCTRFGLDGHERRTLSRKVAHDLQDRLIECPDLSRYERIRTAAMMWKSTPSAIPRGSMALLFSPKLPSNGESSMSPLLRYSSERLSRIPLLGPVVHKVIEGLRNPHSESRHKLRELYRVPIVGYLLESLSVLTRLPRLVDRLNRLDERIDPDLGHGDRIKLLETELPALVNHVSSLAGLVRQYKRMEKRLDGVESRIASVRDELLRELDYDARRTRTGLGPRMPSPERETLERHKGKLPSGDLRIKVQWEEDSSSGVINVGIRQLAGVDLVAEPDNLPFDDGRLIEIHSSHLLQFFSDGELRDRLLPFWFRLLKPGGRLSGIVPDWETVLQQYQSGELPFENVKRTILGDRGRYGNMPRTGFTRKRVEEMVVGSGFRDVSFPYWGLMKDGIIEMHFIAYR